MPGDEASARSLAWRMGFGGLLALSMGIGPLVPYILSALAPSIIQDLGLTRTELGTLATVAFGVATLGSSASGGLTDRLGTRRWLFILHAVAGLALVGVAIAPGFWWLAVAMVLAGVPLAASNPVTNRLLGQQVPAGQRGLMLGVKQSGVQMAQAFAGALLPTVAVYVGWRAASLTGLVFVALALVLSWYLSDDRGERLPRAQRPRGLAHPMVGWLAVFGLLVGMVIQGVNVYLPLYTFEVLGFTETQAGAVAGVVGGVGIPGRIVWGRFAERFRTAVVPMLVVASLSALAVVAIWSSAVAGPLWLWVGVVLFSGATLPSTVVMMMAIVRGVAPARTGKASGQVMLGVYSGFMLGPVAFGAIVDLTDDYAVGFAVLLACSFGAIVVCLAWWRRAMAAAAAGETTATGDQPS
ncbi:MAG: MFS transporter [Nitriliruptoraceae bacterium]|nr:MFS transporter [Nitriliruptoraceae bacterium]